MIHPDHIENVCEGAGLWATLLREGADFHTVASRPSYPAWVAWRERQPFNIIRKAIADGRREYVNHA